MRQLVARRGARSPIRLLLALVGLLVALTGCGSGAMQLSPATPGSHGELASDAAPGAADLASASGADAASPTSSTPALVARADVARTTTPSTKHTTTTGPHPTSAGKVSAVPTAKVAAGATPLLTLGPGTESAVEADVVRLVNVQRVQAGCPALTVHPVLVMVARAHSDQMTASGGFKHNGPDGHTPFQRMTAAGYAYSLAAENIAAGQPTPDAVMAAWMASPGHRANILDCRLEQIGVGMVSKPGSQYGIYWTEDFGTPL
jgi:uncharacterized protein YkwD